jgi:hypothetical protein
MPQGFGKKISSVRRSRTSGLDIQIARKSISGRVIESILICFQAEEKDDFGFFAALGEG